MEGSPPTSLALRSYLHLVPGANPSEFTLCGTNCYLFGLGRRRFLLDPGDLPERNEKYLHNLRTLMSDLDKQQKQFFISHIFVTHHHYDHFGGVSDTISVLRECNKLEGDPQVLKFVDGSEADVLQRYPALKSLLVPVPNGHKMRFPLDDNGAEIEIKCIHTPGHTDDHMSFLATEVTNTNVMGGEALLFSGDIILGGPSTSIRDLTSYMNSLLLLRKEDFSHICLPHSTDLEVDQVVVPGKAKLEAYIKYREEREQQIVEIFQKKEGAVTRDELYQAVYGPRNLQGTLILAAYRNLDLQISKLLSDGFICEVQEEQYKRVDRSKI